MRDAIVSSSSILTKLICRRFASIVPRLNAGSRGPAALVAPLCTSATMPVKVSMNESTLVLAAFFAEPTWRLATLPIV